MRKYTFDYNYFKVINSKNKAYWLGWIVSDGSVNKYNLRLRLQELDIEILQKFKRDVLFTGPITIESNYNKKHQNLCNITLSSVKLIKDLFQLGVISNKVHNTIFPEIPVEFYSHFIRGVFDGDGCIHVNKNGFFHFHISGHDTLVIKINNIIAQECEINANKISKPKCRNISVLNYSGNNVVRKIRNWLYLDCDDLFLQRKHDKFYNSDLKLTSQKYLEENPNSKFTNQQVIEIFTSSIKNVDIAKKFNVKPSTIAAIKTGQNWSEITKDLQRGYSNGIKNRIKVR